MKIILFIQGIGFILLGLLDNNSPQSAIVAALLVIGLGIGMFNPPNNADLLSSVPRERLGNASGMMGLTRTLGMVIGVALSSAIFTMVRNYLMGETGLNPDLARAGYEAAFLGGLRWAFRVAALLSWLGMVMVWGRKDRREMRE